MKKICPQCTTGIAVTYRALDGYSKRRTFRTLRGAQRFAAYWVEEMPEVGPWGATSFDGVGRITVVGCDIYDLFPKLKDVSS